MSHRLRRGLVFVALGLAFASLPLLSRGDGTPPGDKYALLVGVRNYDKNELRNLPYTEADVTALAEVLKKAGYSRVVLMTQTHGAEEQRFLPEGARIRTALQGILEDRAADDTVLVAFAGHGVQFVGEDENYFCPMDARLGDKKTLISLGEVYKALEKSEAGTRLLLADCCRNDPRSEQARAADRVKLESVTRPQRAAPPGGVAAFFSCSAGEKAYEDAELKHGVFFHFIIEGLNGKADRDHSGQVTLDDLVTYTRKRVPDFVKDSFGDDVRQMPELIGKTHGTMALVKLDGGDRPDATTDEGRWKEDVTNAIGMKLKLIHPGKFLMGSPKDEVGREDREGPQHEVEITKPYYMGVYPVTKGQFAAFVKDDGYRTEAEKADSKYTWRDPAFSTYSQTDNDPVVVVSWNDAAAFCTWLSKREGQTYELPTEAEWEYACRAGTTTAFYFPDPKDISEYAWYGGNSGGHTHPVGQKKANPWGLYDMHGNVTQWCADSFDDYREGYSKDPKHIESLIGDILGTNKSLGRVLRGRSWGDAPRLCRSASRTLGDRALRDKFTGFRVALRPAARTR